MCNLPFSRLRVDIGNCGGCGLLCSLDDADRCLDGVCSCGFRGDGCPLGQDCRGGVCLDPDPTGRVCEFDGDCQDLERTTGAWYCIESRCTLAHCIEEVCDGLDNDCDDLVDETDEGFPLTRWCPAGYDFDFLNPPCAAGTQFCSGGSWTQCRGEHLPIPESGHLACDGLDNDCDGCVDGTGPLCTSIRNTTYDVVFVLDMSGSMTAEQMAVLDAMTMFAERFSRPEFRYALVEMPAPPSPGIFSPWWSDLRLDFSDYSTFITELAPLIGMVNGDQEPSYDAIAYLGEEVDLVPSWDPSATRVIIVITDEDGQSTRWLHEGRDLMGDPPEEVTEFEMCASLVHGEILAVVNDPFFWSWFDLCAEMFTLSEDATTMAENLSTIISDPCEE